MRSHGLSLQPNSDRVELDAIVRPFDFLNLKVFGKFIWQRNASEGIPGGGNWNNLRRWLRKRHAHLHAGDWLHPSPRHVVDQASHQVVIEKTLQAGMEAKMYLDTPIGQVLGTLSYNFE